jgi:hypothetical protein
MAVSTTSFCTTYMKQCSTPARVPLAAVGVVAQTPRDVAANFYLHTRLAEVDVAVTAQLKAHRVLHNSVKPLRISDKKVRRSEAIREVGDDGGKASEPAAGFQNDSVCPKDRLTLPRQAHDASNRLRPAVPTDMIGGGILGGSPCPA